MKKLTMKAARAGILKEYAAFKKHHKEMPDDACRVLFRAYCELMYTDHQVEIVSK